MTWQAAPHPDDPPRPVVTTEATAEPEDPPYRRYGRRQPVAMRPRADTPQVGALQLLPLLVAVLSLSSVLFTRGFSWSSVAAAAGIVAVLQFVVARRDRHVLGERGFVDRVPSSTALLSPILYLWLRGRACEGHDADAPLAVRWAIGATVATVVVVAVVAWFHAAIGEGLAVIVTE